MSLKEKIEDNLTLSIIAIAITAFVAGWGATEAVRKAGNSEVITANDLAKLKEAEKKFNELQKEIADKPVPAKTKQQVKVVFVDTKTRLYIKEGPVKYQEGNADFLTHHVELNEQLKKLIIPVKKLTDVPPPGADPLRYKLVAEDVEKEEPDLVVIHRSAFYKEGEQDPNEAKLVAFLKGMKKPNIVFVLYSRKGDTDGKYAADIENKTGLSGRIYPYKFRPGNPFNDGAQVDHFFNTIMLLAHARRDQNVQ
jgi:hypothetical protein